MAHIVAGVAVVVDIIVPAAATTPHAQSKQLVPLLTHAVEKALLLRP